jgi:type II secretory pathway pseudopilin PulG
MSPRSALAIAAAVLAATTIALSGMGPSNSAPGSQFFDEMAKQDMNATMGAIDEYKSLHGRTPTTQWVNQHKQQTGNTTVTYYHEGTIGFCLSTTNPSGTLDTDTTGERFWLGEATSTTAGTRADIEALGTACSQVLMDLDNHSVPADRVVRRSGLDGGIKGVITGAEIDASLFDDLNNNDNKIDAYRATHKFHNPSARWAALRLQHTGYNRVRYTIVSTGSGFCVAARNKKAFIGNHFAWFGTGFKRVTVGTKNEIAKTHTACGRSLRASGY